MEIKVKCTDCGKEMKIMLHIVEKLKAENESLRKELQIRSSTSDMPDFFKDLLFK
jgi:cell shape-determining protein MreC